MTASGTRREEAVTSISHSEIKFPENYGVAHTAVLISILPKAGARTREAIYQAQLNLHSTC